MRTIAFIHTDYRSLFRSALQALFFAFIAGSIPGLLFYVMYSTWPNGPTSETVIGLGFDFFQGAVIATGIVGGVISVSLALFAVGSIVHHLVRTIHAKRGYHVGIVYGLLAAWVSTVASSVAHLSASPAVSLVVLGALIALGALALKGQKPALT